MRRSTRTSVRSVLVGVVVALVASLLTAAPAEAVRGSQVLGHRCRLYKPATTNENTLAALRQTARIAGAACEIDVWTLADGVVIVWHDDTWARVADHSTLPPGVGPDDWVRDATWAQVRQIRTKGGEPVVKFSRMVARAAALDVPLVVEAKNRLDDAWASIPKRAGARVSYYTIMSSTDCSTTVVRQLRDAGARVGVRLPGSTSHRCWLTADQVAYRGFSFVALTAARATRDYIASLDARGIASMAKHGRAVSDRTLVRRGVDRIQVGYPRKAVR